jgi:Domain of unknown function (DUF1707)
MRISDADRDRAAAVLSNALAEGRLTPEEHAERLDAIFAAKTQADITPLIDDLPNAAALGTVDGADVLGGKRRRARMVALFGAITRRGTWRVPKRMTAVTVFGSGHLDFREALLPPGEIRLNAICALGGLEIIVPPHMRVLDSAWAIMGGIEVPPDTQQPTNPDAPVLHVSGVTLMGGISIRRRPRDANPPGERGKLTT